MNRKEQQALTEWLDLHRCCAVCWWPESDWRRACEVHHIAGGAARAKGHHPKNYLRLCDRCHCVYHNGKVCGLFPDLHIGILLTAKQECDPENYDPEFLAQLRNKKHLGKDPEPIPDYYLQERELNVCKATRKP